MKSLYWMLCLLAVLLVSSRAVAVTWKTDKTTGCRFQIPEGWQEYSAQWTGDCVEGLANGSGVLRSFSKGKVSELYYGRVKHGLLDVGVIETDGGYIAGRFADGKPIKDDDRNTYIQAFREGAAAARNVSEFYQHKGNAASARYYAEKAKNLDQQMD